MDEAPDTIYNSRKPFHHSRKTYICNNVRMRKTRLENENETEYACIYRVTLGVAPPFMCMRGVCLR